MPGPKFDYGRPFFNLEIKVIYPEHLSQDNPRAVSHANGLFKGKKHVTEKGYIRSGDIQGLEHKTAILDFENNLTSLGDIVNMTQGRDVYINYNDGSLAFIRVNKNGLYIARSLNYEEI